MMRLKTGKLIEEVFGPIFPDFRRITAERPGFWYCREPVSPQRTYRIVLITHSGHECVLGCDVYAGVFPQWDRHYGTHLLQRSTGLANLRLDSGVIPMKEGYYAYDGTESGAAGTMRRIVSELAQFAVPWFKQAEDLIACDKLVRLALGWMEANFEQLTDDVATQMHDAIRAAKYKAWDVRFAPLVALKELLLKAGMEPDVTLAHRREISRLAVDTLQYAQILKEQTRREE
jgi:hypothetical protein